MPLKKIIRITSGQAPSGYIVGRASAGEGPLELLNLRDLQGLGVASRQQAAQGSARHGFGFSITGRPGNGQVIGIGVWPKAMTFTSAAAGDSVVATVGAHAMAVFNMQALVMGVFTTVGTITFAANGTVGAVAWTGGQYLLAANAQLKLIAPSPQDAALADISGTVIGIQTT